MKLVVIKRNFQILLVPNYRAFRITVMMMMKIICKNYQGPKLSSCLIGTSAQNQSPLSATGMQELIELLKSIQGPRVRSNFFLDTMRTLA